MIIGDESCWAIWMPDDALVAPGPRVTKQIPGRPVVLPIASAIIAAAPSWRQTVTVMLLSRSASSAARKLSPGTQNTCSTPLI
jgi:hypothetical protein